MLCVFGVQIIGAIPYEWSVRKLVVAEALRLAIIPLLILCVAPRTQPVLSHEAWAMTFSGLLGITNGYFGSVPMIMAPAKVSESKKELAGKRVNACLSVGISVHYPCLSVSVLFDARAIIIHAYLFPTLLLAFSRPARSHT